MYGKWDPAEHEAITGYHREDPSVSQATEAGEPSPWCQVTQEKLDLLAQNSDDYIRPPPESTDTQN